MVAGIQMKIGYEPYRVGCRSIGAVVGSVEATFREPDDVSGLEVTGSGSLEWTIPVQSSFCDLQMEQPWRWFM